MTDFPSLAFVDLETTGLRPSVDRITEIGVVTADANEVTEWTTLLNPRNRISRCAQFYNGIDEALLASAPSFKEIAPALAQKLAGQGT
jgi:DNA polymerase-3 subunit epsilon